MNLELEQTTQSLQWIKDINQSGLAPERIAKAKEWVDANLGVLLLKINGELRACSFGQASCIFTTPIIGIKDIQTHKALKSSSLVGFFAPWARSCSVELNDVSLLDKTMAELNIVGLTAPGAYSTKSRKCRIHTLIQEDELLLQNPNIVEVIW